MNRQQAEHILEAYINLENSGGDNKARAALREVILDAMTSYKASTINYPIIAYSPAQTIPTYKPTITCNGNETFGEVSA